jgi:hypothetical protein
MYKIWRDKKENVTRIVIDPWAIPPRHNPSSKSSEDTLAQPVPFAGEPGFLCGYNALHPHEQRSQMTT